VNAKAVSNRYARIGISLLLAICALALIAGVPTILANADCNHPPDFAASENCFAAQFPCPYSYLGVNGTPDYHKALSLCTANNSGEFVALMYLNGEGTPRDPNKAEAALRVWKQKNRGQFKGRQAATIEKAIKRCERAGPKNCPRMDYCKDLGEATLDLEICDARDQLSAEANLSRTIDRIRSTLAAADRAEFDRIVANFKAYQDQEAGRAYEAVGNGMERGLAGTAQAAFVRDHFLNLIGQTIEARKLQPATNATYEAVSRQADWEFSRNLRHFSAARQDLKDPETKDLSDGDRSNIGDYERSARESQLQWIKFRDSSADLASSLYRDHDSKFDPALSMKAAIAKLRIAELRYNPIGPESN